MHSAWTKGLRGEEKAKRIEEVLYYRNAFDDLQDVIEQTLYKKESQIAVNEYNAALDDLLRLIDLNRKDHKE
jgi:hypothetical protein